MNRFSVTISVLILAIGLAFGQEVVDRIIAVVDDDIILESEVLQYAQSLALQNRADPMEYIQNEEIRRDILKQLIEQKVLYSKAEEDTTITVENREVKRELDSRLELMISEVGSEADLERLYGMSIHEIRREFEKTIREGLMVEKLRQKKMMNVKVSRADVEEFYRNNKERLSNRPETVDLAHILLRVEPSKEAEFRAKGLIDSLRLEIERGADFKELAIQYSQDAGSAKRGGNLGWAKRGDFVREYEEVAFSLEPGEVSEPVRTRFGYHLVLLNERQGEKINTSHILIKLEPTEEDRQRVLALGDSIYKMLQDGADFAELAKKYSMDQSTASEGGNLGTFKLEELVSEFKSRIEDLSVGEYTKPFESSMGVQILKVLKRQKPRELTLEKDWETISQIALNQKREEIYQEWLDSLKNDVYIDIRR